jgi:TonB family protein
MVFGSLRVPVLAAGVVVLTSIAGIAADIPELNLNRPHPLPTYPAEAKRAGQTGTTIVAVHVNEIGKPYEVIAEKSSGSPALDKAALEAVHRWHFVPATIANDAVAEWTAVGITFAADGVTTFPVSPDTEVARKDRSRVVCRTEAPTTGSHIKPAPVCKPISQWAEEDRAKKELDLHMPPRADIGLQKPTH